MNIMSFSLIYLVNRFFYRIFDFLRHWYWGGFLTISRWLINALELFDRYFALRITLKNLFKPLYQDYTLIGYTLGFVFRFWRLFSGSIVYFFIIIFFAALFLFWAGIPIYIIYRGYKGW
jgi:hypothetical protein